MGSSFSRTAIASTAGQRHNGKPQASTTVGPSPVQLTTPKGDASEGAEGGAAAELLERRVVGDAWGSSITKTASSSAADEEATLAASKREWGAPAADGGSSLAAAEEDAAPPMATKKGNDLAPPPRP